MRVFLDEISIWIGGLSKADVPLQCVWAPPNLLRAWMEKKGRGRENALCLTAELSSSLCPRHPWFSGLQTQTVILHHRLLCSWAFELHRWSSWLLKIADGRLLDFSASVIPWANIIYLSICLSLYPSIYLYLYQYLYLYLYLYLSLYLYISSIGSVSLENSNLIRLPQWINWGIPLAGLTAVHSWSDSQNK